MAKDDSKQAAKADPEQHSEPQQPPSPQQQQSSSPQPTSPATTSSARAVTFKASAQPAEEAVSGRKREREGSLEPSQLTPSREPIPAKKNRLEDSLQEEDDDTESRHQPETEKVGQIRKKVDELSTQELKTAQTTFSSASQPAAATTTATADAKAQTAAETASATETASESKKDSTLADKPSRESEPVKSSQDPPARTQPTFSAFSSKSSPFSAVPSSSGSSSSSSKSGVSAFAARSSSPLVGSGIKPSSLGSRIGAHHAENGSASPATATTSSSCSKPIAKGSSFGFGAFAGASPLAKSKVEAATTSEKQSKPTESCTDKATFEQKLLSDSKDDSASSESKYKPLLEAPEAETKTGEEDEESVHSIRAKLYTMAEDQSWKERGTGTLRVNIPKNPSDKRPARLVMRADGVLRVILNISLFKGMKCELQEKFVRIIAFEDAKAVHYAIKLSNPNNAAALMDVLDHFVLAPDASAHA
ncbi:hypothetical protein NDA18_004298 [Ustilago nuda]|nr:hypothetical protein NDA18_004298 [Ustilago nuda]